MTLLVITLVAVPSILIVGPLGAAGTPADLLGLVMLVVWVFQRVSTPRSTTQTSGVQIVILLFVIAILISYLAAAVRPIDGLELSAADRGMLAVFAWTGMLLFASDAPTTPVRLDVLLRRIVVAGAAQATVGLTQFATHLSLVNYIVIPGLHANYDLASALGSRGALERPSGTTIHPIEFGAVLTMVLPLALHFALFDTHRSKLRRWLPVLLIAFAIPISISRSAILSAAIGLLVVVPTWSVSVRRRAYAVLVVLVGCVYLTVPGLLGTLQGLFLGISTDSSAASRTNSYALAEDMIRRAPIFGRGFGTFLPKYRILDNQFLGSTIETGLVGLLALLALMAVPIFLMMRARRRTDDERQRHLAVVLSGSIAAAGCSFALYDALSFPMAASMFFLIVGCAGAFVRLDRAQSERPAPLVVERSIANA